MSEVYESRAVAVIDRSELHVDVVLDPLLQAAWAEACEWARGPATEIICIKDFLRGLVFSGRTWPILEQDFKLDIAEAREFVARHREGGSREVLGAFRASDKLQKLILLAKARSLVPGDGIVTVHHLVNALLDMPEEEAIASLFPPLRAIIEERKSQASQLLAERARFRLTVEQIPTGLRTIEEQTKLLLQAGAKQDALVVINNGVAAAAASIQQLSALVADSPGLEAKLGPVRDQLRLLDDRTSELKAQLLQQVAALKSQSDLTTEVLMRLDRDLDHKLNTALARIEQAVTPKPWRWPWQYWRQA